MTQTQSKTNKPVFSAAVAGKLIDRGFPIVDRCRNYKDPTKWVYYFEVTPALIITGGQKHMDEEKSNSANAIVIYQSMYKQFLRLSKKNPEMAIEYIMALLKYGFEGIEPDDDNDVMMYGFDADKIALDNAAVRHLKAQENGAKGGQPTKRPPAAELQQKYEEPRTWAAVATYYGVNERTVRRWCEADKTDNVRTRTKPGKTLI